mgnify:CR=1 FL=1
MKRKRIFSCFLTVMLVLVMAMPVFAASGKTPSAVSVTKAAAAKNSVTVTWKRASNATSYRVYYKKAGARKWTVLANVSSKTTKYVHKTSRKYPLQGGKKYSYTVRAYNKYSKKWGRYDSKGKTVTIPVVPSAVKMGSVKADSYNQVSVTWKPAGNVTEYQVFYRPASTTKWTLLSRTNGKTLKYVHKSSSKYPLKPGQRYVYTVRGYNKTFKTTGSYNKNGVTVQVPKKPSVTATPKPAATPKPTETPLNTEKFIKEVIRLTNIERKKAGKSSVQENAALDKGAAVRAKECALVKYSHTRPDGTNANTAYHEAGAGNIRGENIAVGFRTPKEFVNGVVNSPGHYVTMADSGATHIGVGCYKKDGVIYWVQIFAKNPDQKFTLTVDANGGTFPDKGGVEKYTMQIPAGMKFSLTNITKPEKLNAKFQKWTVVDSTDIPYGVEDYIIMYETQILKANWTENPS